MLFINEKIEALPFIWIYILIIKKKEHKKKTKYKKLWIYSFEFEPTNEHIKRQRDWRFPVWIVIAKAEFHFTWFWLIPKKLSKCLNDCDFDKECLHYWERDVNERTIFFFHAFGNVFAIMRFVDIISTQTNFEMIAFLCF